MALETEPHAWEVFRDSLGESSVLMPFARGVALHLAVSGALDREPGLLQMTAELLRSDGGEIIPLAERLAAAPVLLASFFQNLDLLPPRSPETKRVAVLVAEAMQILSPAEE